MPNDDVGEAYDVMVRRWSQLEDRERAHTLPTTGAPDAGMAWMLHRWASGQRLEVVLRDSEIAAGDFVRHCKQVIDLLGQIGDAAAEPTLSVTARPARATACASASRGSTCAGTSVMRRVGRRGP